MSYDTPSSGDPAARPGLVPSGLPSEPSSPASVPLEVELPLPVAWLSWDAAKVLRRLRHCDYTAYLVGGCVRDLLLGRYPKDFDIATSALPKEVKRAFSNCRLIGRRFRLAHIIFQNSIIEVATFRRDPGTAELEEEPSEEDEWFPRRRRRKQDEGAGAPVEAAATIEEAEAETELSDEEVEPDEGDDRAALASEAEAEEQEGLEAEEAEEAEAAGDLLIRSDNVFGSPQEDALRRDFTINGLFFDVSTQRLIDWVGGLKDIEARVIRTIGVPEVRLREDPIRMLRAVKFAAALRFTIEPRTWQAMCQVAPDITRSAPPRILEEIFRMMRGGASEACFRLMALSGLLKQILPELDPLVELELAAGASGSASSRAPLRLRMGSSDVAAGTSSESSASPLRMSEAVGEESEGEAVAGVLGYLHALDQVDQAGMPMPNHLLLALLSLVPIFRMLNVEPGSPISDQVFRTSGFLLEEMGSRLRVARRDRERARLVLLGLTKIVWRSERSSSLTALARKSYFSESLILYSLHCLAVGTGVEELRRLVKRVSLTPEVMRVLEAVYARFPEQQAPTPGPAGGAAESGAGTPRRRRRRRRRRRAEEGGSSGELSARERDQDEESDDGEETD